MENTLQGRMTRCMQNSDPKAAREQALTDNLGFSAFSLARQFRKSKSSLITCSQTSSNLSTNVCHRAFNSSTIGCVTEVECGSAFIIRFAAAFTVSTLVSCASTSFCMTLCLQTSISTCLRFVGRGSI